MTDETVWAGLDDAVATVGLDADGTGEESVNPHGPEKNRMGEKQDKVTNYIDRCRQRGCPAEAASIESGDGEESDEGRDIECEEDFVPPFLAWAGFDAFVEEVFFVGEKSEGDDKNDNKSGDKEPALPVVEPAG